MEFRKQAIKTSVVACVVDAADRVLLTRRSVEPFHGLWVMPGGKIDHGEPILQALHREVREEVGIEVRVEGLLDAYEHIGIGEAGDHFVILYYRAAPLSLELRPDGVECDEALWAESASLPQRPLAPGARHVLSRLFPQLPWGKALESDAACSPEHPGYCALGKD
jgi:8-oxo-dGTP diphosphatase